MMIEKGLNAPYANAEEFVHENYSLRF